MNDRTREVRYWRKKLKEKLRVTLNLPTNGLVQRTLIIPSVKPLLQVRDTWNWAFWYLETCHFKQSMFDLLNPGQPMYSSKVPRVFVSNRKLRPSKGLSLKWHETYPYDQQTLFVCVSINFDGIISFLGLKTTCCDSNFVLVWYSK